MPSALQDKEQASPSFTSKSDNNVVNTDGLIWCSGVHSMFKEINKNLLIINYNIMCLYFSYIILYSIPLTDRYALVSLNPKSFSARQVNLAESSTNVSSIVRIYRLSI